MYKEMLESQQKILALFDQIEGNEGELTPELEKEFDKVMQELAKTADQFVDTIKYLESIRDNNKAKAQLYSAKAKATDNHINFLKETAKSMLLNNIPFEGDAHIVKLIKKKVEIIDETKLDSIPKEYIEYLPKINKRKLLKDVKDGKIKTAAYSSETRPSLYIR